MLYSTICPISNPHKQNSSNPSFFVENKDVKENILKNNQLILKFCGNADEFRKENFKPDSSMSNYRLDQTVHNPATLFVNWPQNFKGIPGYSENQYKNSPDGSEKSVFDAIYKKVKSNVQEQLNYCPNSLMPLEIIVSGQSLGGHAALNIANKLLNDSSFKNNIMLKGVIVTNTFKSISASLSEMRIENSCFLNFLFNLLKPLAYILLYFTNWNLDNEALLKKLQKANIPLLIANCKNDSVIPGSSQLACSQSIYSNSVSVEHLESSEMNHNELYSTRVTEFIDAQFTTVKEKVC